jgi:tRNA threonylcarbamoyladenosine biosynthesis protein TsaB
VTIVGFDTSTAATTACVLRDDGEAFETLPRAERLLGPPGHSRELLSSVAEVMERAGVQWADVHAIAVGIGPGTFTGLRIGVASARAMATARRIPVHPVSSLAALAAGMESPRALPLIDAKRGEVFAALYDGEDELWPPFAAGPERLIERVREAALTVTAAGDGSLRFRAELEAGGIELGPAGAHAVRGLHICRLASLVPAVPPEAVLPNYLRDPDAKPQR